MAAANKRTIGREIGRQDALERVHRRLHRRGRGLDVGKAARDWPRLNFIVYHSAYRFRSYQCRFGRLALTMAFTVSYWHEKDVEQAAALGRAGQVIGAWI